jgi:hypothetical protein
LLVVEEGVDLGSEGDLDSLVSLPLRGQQGQVSDVLLIEPRAGRAVRVSRPVGQAARLL